MSNVNHFAISSILHSEIVGKFKSGHGQIRSLADAQKQFDVLAEADRAASDRRGENAPDIATVSQAFLLVRDEFADKRSPDFYIADPERNSKFLEKCRELGVTASDYAINKALLYARKTGKLRGLKSRKTSLNYETYAFACEFAATELRYETGASVDELLCDPALAARFDSIARKFAPGVSPTEYRWAALSIRKAGRNADWKPDYKMPALSGRFGISDRNTEALPVDMGVYVLFEKEKALYARATEVLRFGIELHLKPETVSAFSNPFWQPAPSDLYFSFATITEKKLLHPVERKIIEDKRPIFNIPRRD